MGKDGLYKACFGNSQARIEEEMRQNMFLKEQGMHLRKYRGDEKVWLRVF